MTDHSKTEILTIPKPNFKKLGFECRSVFEPPLYTNHLNTGCPKSGFIQIIWDFEWLCHMTKWMVQIPLGLVRRIETSRPKM